MPMIFLPQQPTFIEFDNILDVQETFALAAVQTSTNPPSSTIQNCRPTRTAPARGRALGPSFIGRQLGALGVRKYTDKSRGW
jgi:hypothetical protein